MFIIPIDSFVPANDQMPVNDQADALNKLRSIIEGFIDDNYLEASLDSLYYDSLAPGYKALIFRGPYYEFKNIGLDSIDPALLKRSALGSLNSRKDYIRFREFITRQYAEEGYPFANMRLVSGEDLKGYLRVDPGPLIIVDSLMLKGSLNISKNYISRYLDIPEGSIYRHSRIMSIDEKLSELNFATQSKPPELTFFGTYSSVSLYLEEKNTSRFDFIFGIIPSTSFNDRSLFLSADLTAEMRNRLGYGEYIYVDFERLRPEQQRFEFNFNFPYFLKLDYGLDIEFSIFRLGLEYQTLQSDIGIEYIINPTDRLKLSWSYESSNIVELDTSLLLNTGMLPQDLDVSQNGVAFRYSMNRLDYRLNPRSGYAINLKAGGGVRSIKRNSSILQLKNDNYDFSESYDSLALTSSRFEIRGQVQKYFPTGRRTSIASILSFGWRYSSQELYRNEKFQIGGNKLLRGFDEARFFTSYYTVCTLANRLLLSNNSYMSIPFIDLAILEDSNGNMQKAIGFGSGLGIETNAGLFQFSIAVGRTESSDFDFRRPKVHLGFASLF